MRRPVVAVSAALAALALATTGFLVTRDSEEEVFKKSAHRAEFCGTAGALDLQRDGEMTPHKRRHVIEDLNKKAPEGISGDFSRLLAWYDHPEPESEKSARRSSYRVGEFIERVCDGINIGGIRS
ncbi:hypothetical protein [Streptomyces sp. NPDC051662]|uniref:hypothetical protein n=1 Tax=Streptomyces sp. NPDC051662 TaxID=3154750 RepID=UPI003418EBA1